MAKDYAAIAAAKISRPADVKRPPRFLVYSRNKKGKTRFALSAGINSTLILDPEGGTDQFKKLNPHRWAIERWEDWDEAYQYLRHERHPYKWVGVDGLTKASNQALKYVMKIGVEQSMTRQVGLVQQRDYGKAGELVKDLLNNFYNLPMGVVFTAQERMVEAVDDTEDDEDSDSADAAFVPDLPKGVKSAANAIVDVIGRLYVVKVDGAGGKKIPERRLWIGESVKYDTGYRSDFAPLPEFVRRPTVPKLVSLIQTGKLPEAKAATA